MPLAKNAGDDVSTLFAIIADVIRRFAGGSPPVIGRRCDGVINGGSLPAATASLLMARRTASGHSRS